MKFLWLFIYLVCLFYFIWAENDGGIHDHSLRHSAYLHSCHSRRIGYHRSYKVRDLKETKNTYRTVTSKESAVDLRWLIILSFYSSDDSFEFVGVVWTWLNKSEIGLICISFLWQVWILSKIYFGMCLHTSLLLFILGYTYLGNNQLTKK